MQTMGNKKFSVGMFEDKEKWDAWVKAVEDDSYNASQAQKDAVSKFSSYVLKVECETTGSTADGCCMFLADPKLGGWCLFQNGSAMDTYRLPSEDSEDFIQDGFSSS